MQKCLICERIELIKNNQNKFFVKELPSGYVVLGDYQYYNGYTLLLSKTHTDELHKLTPKDRSQFLEDMALTAEAVYKAFQPNKLNYELLGNSDSHLHWHIFPRYKDDPQADRTVWVTPYSIRSAETPSEGKINELKDKLLTEINKLMEVRD
jgi:diadenosine tetraphosphate (Ap4A) HIT family hydrolase